MKSFITALSILFTFNIFAAEELVHIETFQGEPEAIIELCHNEMELDVRCDQNSFSCSCSDNLASAGIIIFEVSAVVDEPISTPSIDIDEDEEYASETCTFFELKKTGRKSFEIGQKFVGYGFDSSTSEAKESACIKAEQKCREDQSFNHFQNSRRVKCVRSDRITKGKDYADEEEYTAIDAAIDGLEMITDIISIFK